MDSATGNKCVTGPDGYRFMLVDTDQGDSNEPFLYVSINVSDLTKSKDFYCNVLGAKVYDEVSGVLGTPNSVAIGFADDGTKIELVESDGKAAIDHKFASGRFATETEDGAPAYMGERVRASGGTILHGPIKLKPHNEEVVIVADPDGYEYCFVDARGYTNCVNVAYAEGGTTVDWEFRSKLLEASKSENPKLEVAKVLAKDYDTSAVRARIEQEIKKPVVVFSQTSCEWCSKTKSLLTAKGAKYDAIELDAVPEGNAIRVELAEISGKGTVTQMSILPSCVGNFLLQTHR
mmetsp:Transcript_3770/g.5951  ORF Transcript_3770/g.5951 Transcript_3770/m.5951 type:complete len:291 (-) Transcript_3770:473-1345(-)